METETLALLIALAVGCAVLAGILFAKRGGAAGKEAVDPIAEADVYLAYGRRAQAIALLEAAQRNDPQHAAIAEKLAALKARK